ncbi:MAG TPA: hypothetical protein VGA73_10440 [Candidatus Binatia bacterium]
MSYGTRLTVDDKIRSLFQLDPVLPQQYQNTFQRRFPLAPEKTLMMAVMEDAIGCVQKYARSRNPKSAQMFRDAEEWILEKDSEWLFSFDQICSSLGWNPSYVRRGLIEEMARLAAARGQPKNRLDGGGASKKGCKGKRARLAA